MNDFNEVGFIAYMEYEFGCKSLLVRRLLQNLIDYGYEHEHISKDQFCNWLADIIPEITFGEVAAFMDDACLTDNGKIEKQEALSEMNRRT